MLNDDQAIGVKEIFKWWTGPEQYFVLHGKAGTGKTHMAFEAISKLPLCKPILTAPTNAAVKQLQKTLPKHSKIKVQTVHSLLNVYFKSDDKGKLNLVQGNKVKDDFNLLVIDEASFIGDSKAIASLAQIKVSLFDLIKSTNKKVLYIGHKSQLPEVQEGQLISAYDKCESVVFQQNYPVYNLTQPVRAKGKLQEAHDYLENLIYEKIPRLRNDWKVTKSSLKEYILSPLGHDEILAGETNFLGYTNAVVDKTNQLIREAIFGADISLLVKNDKILLTKPSRFAVRLNSKMTEKEILRIARNSLFLESNSHFTVKSVGVTFILNLQCFEVETVYEGSLVYLYIPVSRKEYQNWEQFLMRKMFASGVGKPKAKVWEEIHLIKDCFTEFKHSYAMTVHRSQGSTIPKVFVSWEDIQTCRNTALRMKLLYVAGSRSSKELYIRG